MSLLERSLVVAAAVVIDQVLGEPTHFHPLVGMGHLINAVERRFRDRGWLSRPAGVAAVASVIVPPAALVYAIDLWLARWPLWQAAFGTTVLYVVVAAKGLKQVALKVHADLLAGNLEGARANMRWLVKRESARMEAPQMINATIESVLENGSDAAFGSLFWFMVLGPAGACVHRLSNTLDACWGLKNDRFYYFGWCAARLDDLLNLAPARVTAVLYALAGNSVAALRCWRTQASAYASPNGGVTMSAGAGALGVTLGGIAYYEGRRAERGPLGMGPAAIPSDILRAVRLLDRSLMLGCALLVGVGLWSHFAL